MKPKIFYWFRAGAVKIMQNAECHACKSSSCPGGRLRIVGKRASNVKHEHKGGLKRAEARRRKTYRNLKVKRKYGW